MLKAVLSYSKKIPVEGHRFASQCFHLALEQEIPANLGSQELQTQLHEAYELVKQTVETELSCGKGMVAPAREPRRIPATVPGNGNAQPKASNKQINYLTSLANEAGISISELNARVRDLYGASGLYDLSRRDASKLVDDLKRLQQKAA